MEQPRRAHREDAQSILDQGCWGLPRLFDRHLELQKPPLYYWVVATLARLRGGVVDAMAVRLPATLTALGGVIALFVFGVWRSRPLVGVVAAATVMTAVHYTWLARVGRIDMPLAFFVAIALGAFYLGYVRQNAGQGTGALGYFLVAYAAIAAAVLLKGPIGALLPAAVAGTWLAVEGRLPGPCHFVAGCGLARELGIGWGFLVLVGLAAPWYVWAAIQTNGSLLSTFFWHHNIERAIGGTDGLRAKPWWFYAPRLAVDFLPWTPVLVGACYYFLRRRRWADDPEARFGLVWLAVMVFVLSLAGFKRADYLLPAYPGAALVIGCAAERWMKSAPQRKLTMISMAGVVAGCA